MTTMMTRRDRIIAAVLTEWGVTKEDLASEVKTPDIYEARITAIYLLRNYTDATWPEISAMFSRSLTAVRYSGRLAVDSRMLEYPTYRKRLAQLEAQFIAENAGPPIGPRPDPVEEDLKAKIVLAERNAEIRKLRHLRGKDRGWSVGSLARRFLMTPMQIREVLGDSMVS